MMQRIWDLISLVGLRRVTGSLTNRTIILSNRLNFLMALVLFLLFLVAFLRGVIVEGIKPDLGAYRMIPVIMVLILNIFLAKTSNHDLVKLLLTYIPVTGIIILPTLMGYVQEHGFYYYPIAIIGFSLIPQLIYIPKYDPLTYLPSIIFFLVLLIFYDLLLIRFMPEESMVVENIKSFYIYYKLVPILVFIFLHLAIRYLQNLNIRFEQELLESNRRLNNSLTELRNTQEQLIHTEKMASLGILSAGVSHEINNSLNFIKGGVNELKKGIGKEKSRKKESPQSIFTIIDEGINRASSIVTSLNHFSRQTESHLEICDIHLIMDNCLRIMNNITKNRIDIIRNYTSQSFTLTGNSGKLHQAILNILINAEQSIRNKGEIHIESILREDHGQILIRDTGTGIDQKIMPRIFDPFFTTKDPGKGTGLGLSIARKIIEDHGGKISLKSASGTGTEVSIIFPLKKTNNISNTK